MEVVKCRFCGKVLKSITSMNIGYGPECAKKHFKRRTLLEAWEDHMKKENKEKIDKLSEIKEVVNSLIAQLSNGSQKDLTISSKYSKLLEETGLKLIFEGVTQQELHMKEDE